MLGSYLSVWDPYRLHCSINLSATRLTWSKCMEEVGMQQWQLRACPLTFDARDNGRRRHVRPGFFLERSTAGWCVRYGLRSIWHVSTLRITHAPAISIALTSCRSSECGCWVWLLVGRAESVAGRYCIPLPASRQQTAVMVLRGRY
jgi:hypothetical protein